MENQWLTINFSGNRLLYGFSFMCIQSQCLRYLWSPQVALCECTLTVFWSVSCADRFNVVQKRIIVRTSQLTCVVTDISMFTGTWFVEFASPRAKIFTVLPESEKLTVPPVSTHTVTLYRFHMVGKLTFGTALIKTFFPIQGAKPDFAYSAVPTRAATALYETVHFSI